jgi:hypothetical protein
MADRLLLESGAPDGYLLEDSSGVLLLEAVSGVTIVKAVSLYTSTDNSASVPYSTASWTPVAGRGYVVVVHSHGLGTAARPTVAGNNQTWTFGGEAGVGGANYHGYWYVDSAASPTTDTLDVTFDTAASGCTIQVFEATGHDTSDMVGSTFVGQGSAVTSASMDISPAFENAGSATIASVRQVSSDSAWTDFHGLTQLEEGNYASPNGRFTMAWAATPIDPAIIDYTTSANWRGIALEIKPAAGAGAQTVGPLPALGTATTPAPTLALTVGPLAALGGATVVAPQLNLRVAVALLGGASAAAPLIVGAQAAGPLAALGGATAPAPQINLSLAVPALGPATAPAPQINLRLTLAALGGGTAPAPTVAPGNVTVGPFALLGGATVLAPQLNLRIFIPALGPATAPAPQLLGAIGVSVLGGATVPEPTVSSAAGPQTVGPLALLGPASLAAPQINLRMLVALLGGATAPAPAVGRSVAVSALGGASSPAPAVIGGPATVGPLPALGTASVPAPMLVSGVGRGTGPTISGSGNRVPVLGSGTAPPRLSGGSRKPESA